MHVLGCVQICIPNSVFTTYLQLHANVTEYTDIKTRSPSRQFAYSGVIELKKTKTGTGVLQKKIPQRRIFFTKQCHTAIIPTQSVSLNNITPASRHKVYTGTLSQAVQ